MNHKNLFLAITLGLCVSSVHLQAGAAEVSAKAAQLPDFIYQGRLEQNGLLASGQYDLTFRLYTEMLRIRRFEESAARAYTKGKISGFLHLYIGQATYKGGISTQSL